MAEQDKNSLILPPASEATESRAIQLDDSFVSDESTTAELQLDSLSDRRRLELEELKRRIILGHRELTVVTVYLAAKALQIGTYVLRAKDIVGHGRFLRWIDQEVTPHCGLAQRTVQRYTKLARESDCLIERIRQIHRLEDGPALELEDARRILTSMRLSDALSLLRFGVLRSTSEDSAIEIVDVQYEEAASRFFAMANAPFAAQVGWESKSAEPLTGYQFVSPANSRENRSLVIKSVAAHQAGDLFEGLLLLSGGGSDRWLHMLDDFPRVLLRDSDSPHQASSDKQYLFGLIAACRFEDFHQAFHPLGAVLVPFCP